MVYGVPQIIRLSQAKVSDDTIIAYVKNCGLSYNLDADQIIYLRQQGVSDAVITTMLNQPKPAVIAYTPATPAPQPVASSASTQPASTTSSFPEKGATLLQNMNTSTQPVPTTTVAPTVTYVQTVPTTTYYYQPYYYPAYAWFPPVSLSFAWGSGWHGGGYYGGWHH
jgi:hypothetical protein